jgi:hypothetical protein
MTPTIRDGYGKEVELSEQHVSIMERIRQIETAEQSVDNEIIALEKEKERLQQLRWDAQRDCQHIDNGGFMYGFCMVCGACLG